MLYFKPNTVTYVPFFDLGGSMQPRFNIERDRENSLFLRSYKNDFCLFQFHSQVELYFIDEGEMEIFVGGKLTTLRAGEVSVALGYDPHAYRTPSASRSSVLLIPQYMCEEFISATRGKRLESPFITDPTVVAELKMYYNALKDEGVGRIRQIGYVYTILGIIMDNMRFVDADIPTDTDLGSRMLFYINENYKSPITPATIAQHFGYNQSYISRYFKSCFGINLGKYLTVTRLKCAVLTLGEGKHDMTYCALESGFSSMRTFYRAFHAEFGMSPKEYMHTFGAMVYTPTPLK